MNEPLRNRVECFNYYSINFIIAITFIYFFPSRCSSIVRNVSFSPITTECISLVHIITAEIDLSAFLSRFPELYFLSSRILKYKYIKRNTIRGFFRFDQIRWININVKYRDIFLCRDIYVSFGQKPNFSCLHIGGRIYF